MKIGPPIDSIISSDIASRNNVRTSASPSRVGEVSTEKIAVSPAAAQMGAMGGSSDFDSAKVDAIRTAIREGRFNINPDAIADRLITDAVALLGARSA